MMTSILPLNHVARILLLLPLLLSSAFAFQASSNYRVKQRTCILLRSSFGNSNNNAGGSTFPSSFNPNAGSTFPSSFNPNEQQQQHDETVVEGDQEEEEEAQTNTRFSKFAPDLNLDAADFRLQLRENMKADLERRRNEDPNRGNQIAKNYLDSL